MSSYSIHRAVSIKHKIRVHGDFSTNTLVVTDSDGKEHDITLYADAPLSIESAVTDEQLTAAYASGRADEKAERDAYEAQVRGLQWVKLMEVRG